MKIVTRFILFVSLPVLCGLVAMSILLYVVSSRALEDEYEKRLSASARQAESLMMDDIERVRSDLITLQASRLLDRYFMYSDVGEADYKEDVRASIEENFLTVSRAKPEYASLRIFGLDGEGIVNITEQRTAYHYPDPRQTDWFKSSLLLHRGEIHVSPVLPCPEHHDPSIYVSQVVYYWDKPRAVVSIHLHCQPFFSRLLHEFKFGKGGYAYLVDAAGRVIAHADPGLVSTVVADPGVLAAILAGQETMRIEQDISDTFSVKNVYLPSGIEGAVLVTGQPLAELQSVSSTLRRHLTWIAVLVSIGLVVLIIAMVRTIVKPLARLKRITSRIAGGELEARVGIISGDEIGRLAASFDAMADSLQNTRDNLRDEITERRQVAEELRQAQATLETIFNNVIPLCITNKDFEIIKSNDAYNAIFGKPGQGDARTKCYDSRPGEFCGTTRCSLRRILEGGEQEVSREVIKKDHNGQEKVFILTTRPFINADNELLGVVQSFQDITVRRRSEDETKRLLVELQGALAKVKLLSGFLPICSSCKKIRDDKGYWNQIESYIRQHSEAEFSHSLCPECAQKLYPEFDYLPKDKKE
jgi:PAS domain S-box-containing protein